MAKRRSSKPTSVTGDSLSPKISSPDPRIVKEAFEQTSRALESAHSAIRSAIVEPINDAINTVQNVHYRIKQPILDPIIKSRSAVDIAASQIHDAIMTPLMNGFNQLQDFNSLFPNPETNHNTYQTTVPDNPAQIAPSLPGVDFGPIEPPDSSPPENLPTIPPQSSNPNNLPLIQLYKASNQTNLPFGTASSPAGVLPAGDTNSAGPEPAGVGTPAGGNVGGGSGSIPPGLAGSCPGGTDPVELTHTGTLPNGNWIWSYPDGTVAEQTGAYTFPVRLFKCQPSNIPSNNTNPGFPPTSGGTQQSQPCIPICQPVPPPCSVPSPIKPSKPTKTTTTNPTEPTTTTTTTNTPGQPGEFPSFTFDGCDVSGWGNEDWNPCCSDVSTTDQQGTQITSYLQQLVSWFVSEINDSGVPLAGTIGDFVSSIGNALAGALGEVLSGIGLDSGVQASMILERIVLGVVNKHTGGAFKEAIDRVDYALNATYPHVLPSAESGVAGYLSGVYSYDTCRCIWGFNGKYKGYLDPTIEMERRRTSVEESLVLYRRGDIDDQELADRIRRNGWIRDQDIEELKTLNTQIPGIGQLISYMVRDVADDNIVNKFGLDTDFDIKYTGQVKSFAEQQGIHPDYAKLAWRSHWTIPPPSTLYEILHRLRHNPQFGGEQQVLEDVKEALKQQDILPFWIDRLLEISYHPINRIDAQRGFEFGAFDDQDLLEAYYAQGYKDDIAEKLVSAAKLRVVDKLKTNQFVKAYSSGVINSQQLSDSLTSIGYPPEIIEQLKTNALLYENLENRKAVIGGIITNFVKGGSDEQELRDSLESNSVDPEQIDFIVETAIGKRESQVKHIPASEWVKWMIGGFVESTDATNALLRLGYSWDDVHRIISAAMEDHRQKEQLKEAKKLAAEQKAKESEYLKEQRLLIQQEKAAQTEELRKERMALRLERMQQQEQQRAISYQNKLNAARRAKAKQTAAIRLQLNELIANVMKKTGVDEPTATSQVNSLIATALSNGDYYKQEAISGLAHLITIWTSKIGVDYPTFAKAVILQGALTSADAMEAWKQSPQYQPPSIA